MKRTILLVLMAGLLTMGGRSFAGDTGAYRILNYTVNLTPHSDGTVAIDYHQRWLVTGGHIPWITVGTSNGSFEVVGHGGAASGVSSASEGGWSGVRIDLDRDYQSGQTFYVSFSVIQKGLFYAEEKNYKLDFTPGWYDRARIDTMSVSVKFLANMQTVTANPKPSLVSGDAMVWNAYDLGAGEHFTIHVSFPVGLFPAGIAKGNLKGGAGAGSIIPIVFLIFVVFVIIVAIRSSKGRYSGGRIFYGGFWGGGAGRGGSGGGRSAGGGGGFGGASMSCACACVSCACACACAGGGGAGCARKLEHSCPICDKRKG
ncbi:MAG: hypothetical protein ABR899_07340 [Candidatus Krumholzibacteriaceae bacterium]|jgi:hypothetical protein